MITWLKWRLGISKPSFDRVKNNIRKDKTLANNGYCAMCRSSWNCAPFNINNIIEEKQVGKDEQFISRCKRCGTKYLFKEFGVKEDTSDIFEKYIDIDNSWVLLGRTKNLNRDNEKDQIFVGD